jgi:nitrate reductase NapD
LEARCGPKPCRRSSHLEFRNEHIKRDRPRQPRPNCLVKAGISGLNGVEMHAISPEGKLIVTIETEDDDGNVATYESIGRLDGVMSAAMVYHQPNPNPIWKFQSSPGHSLRCN